MNTFNLEAVSVPFTPTAASTVAYETCKEEITEAASGELTPINVDVLHAARVMQTVVGNVAPFRARMANLGECDQGLIDKLEIYSQALVYAHSLHTWTLDGGQPIEPIVAEVVELRRILKNELEVLHDRGILPREAIKLAGGNGRLSMAGDVRSIASIFSANWATVGPVIGGDLARIDAAAATADRLASAVAREEQVQEKLKGTTLMRAAAWTLAFKAYREVLRAMTCVRFHDGDVENLVPNVFTQDNTPKKGKKDASTTPTPATDPIAPAPSPLPSPSNGGSTPNIPVAPVFPSKPFQ